MNWKTYIVPVGLAALIGITLRVVLAYLWSYIAVYNPLPSWLFGAGLSGLSFTGVILILDLFVSAILSLPAAYLLWKLRPKNLLLFVTVALLPAFIWEYRSFYFSSFPVDNFLVFIPGIVLYWLSLPIAVAFILRSNRRKDA